MKVGINLELMEDVLKEPLTIQIGTGGGVPDTASTESTRPGTVGGGRRSNVEYEKAPWIEATVRSVLSLSHRQTCTTCGSTLTMGEMR